MRGDGWLASIEVCQTTGITYRQLDYWLHSHVIPNRHIIGGIGSGNRRRLSPDVIKPLTVLQHITDAFGTGQGKQALTMDALREIYTIIDLDEEPCYELGPGVWLKWDA